MWSEEKPFTYAPVRACSRRETARSWLLVLFTQAAVQRAGRMGHGSAGAGAGAVPGATERRFQTHC